MERSTGTTAKSESEGGTSDWRVEFTTDTRHKIVNRLLNLLKTKLPHSDPDVLCRLNEVCLKVEQSAFSNARTKDLYIRTIAEKKKQIEGLPHQSVDAFSAKTGLTQTSMVAGASKSSSLQNVSSVSHDHAGGSVEQGMQPNMSANNWREIRGGEQLHKMIYQQRQTQESQHPFLEQNVHQPNVSDLQNQLDIHDIHQHQQKLPVESQLSLFHCSHHPTLPTELGQPVFMEQSCNNALPQNQLLTRGVNVSQKPLSQSWKSMPKSYQKTLCLQNNSFGLQQLQRIGPQSNIMNLQSCQNSAHVPQRIEDRSSQHQLHQRMQPVQFQQLLDAKKLGTGEAAQHKQQMMGTLLDPQTVINQQKLISSQRTLADASSALLKSTVPSELANIAGRHDEGYQTFQSMKEKYLPELTCILNNLNVIQKSSEQERVGTCKELIIAVKKFIDILSAPQYHMAEFSKSSMQFIENSIIKFINFYEQNGSVSVKQRAQLLRPPGGQPHIPQSQQLGDGNHQFPPVNLASKGTEVGSSPLSLTQQVGLEQGNGPKSLQQAAMISDQNTVDTQRKNRMPNTITNSFDSAIISLEQNDTINPHQQQKKHQVMQPENLEQYIQLDLIQPKFQQVPKRNIHPIATSVMLQSMSSQQHIATSSPMSQHSAQIDWQNSPSPFSKVELPLSSASSPLITASPSTPLTPLSKAPDHQKYSFVASPLSNSGKCQPQTISTIQLDAQNEVLNQSLVALPVKSASFLCAESRSLNGNRQAATTKKPLDRLLKAVESLTPEALTACVSEIGSVMKQVDMIAGINYSDSETAVVEALAPETPHHLHTRDFTYPPGCIFEVKMKRKISTKAPDVLLSSPTETDNLKQSTGHVCGLDSTETSRIKKRRIEPNGALLKEIRFINQRLLETVIDLDSTEDTATLHANEGTIVRCAYNAAALNENFKMHASQIFPILPLRLFVPASYPSASPVILDGLTADLRCNSRQSIDLSEKTKSRFRISLRMLSEPMSLAEIARTWDTSARAVFLEYAELIEAESFSSRYGTWENCVTA